MTHEHITDDDHDKDIVIIPLEFLDERVPNFATDPMDQIEAWFNKFVDEGIFKIEFVERQLAQIQNSRKEEEA